MRKKRSVVCWMMSVVLVTSVIFAGSAHSDQQAPIALQKCISHETGVAFACLPTWKLHRKGRVLKVIVSRSPRVEVDIEETDQKVRFLHELTREALASSGRYADGFHIERFSYCDRETVKVNGYLKGDPVKRVSDFYLIDHLNIHSIKFTAQSTQAWEEYKFIIKQIVESVTFIHHDQPARFHSEEKDATCEEMLSTAIR